MPVFSPTHALSRSARSTISQCTRLTCDISFQRSKHCDPLACLMYVLSIIMQDHATMHPIGSIKLAPCLCGKLEHVCLLVGNESFSELDGRFRAVLLLLLFCRLRRQRDSKGIARFKARGGGGGGGDSITTFRDQVRRPKLRWVGGLLEQ